MPKSEDECMESLLTTIKQYYELDKQSSEFTVERTAGKGNQDKFCEYTGGGDIYTAKKQDGSTLSFANLENLQTSPSNSMECIAAMSIEGKDGGKRKTTNKPVDL